MPKKTTADSQSAKQKEEQSIQHLRQRFEQLNERKIQFQTKRDEAVKRLEDLKRQAKEQFGTDNIEELQEILAERKSANEKKRSQYQAGLDQIEQQLAEIDADFAEDELNDGD